MSHESLDNIGYVCPAHAPKPQEHFAQFEPQSLIGHYVKRAFPARGRDQGRLEHMWVEVIDVLPDGSLVGHLNNDPILDVGYVCGNLVSVEMAEIEDVCD